MIFLERCYLWKRKRCLNIFLAFLLVFFEANFKMEFFLALGDLVFALTVFLTSLDLKICKVWKRIFPGRRMLFCWNFVLVPHLLQWQLFRRTKKIWFLFLGLKLKNLSSSFPSFSNSNEWLHFFNRSFCFFSSFKIILGLIKRGVGSLGKKMLWLFFDVVFGESVYLNYKIRS